MGIAQMTIGEIAAHIPASVTVFEKFNIDYSCAGNKSLARACRESGLAAEQILLQITEAQSSSLEDERVDWTELPLVELIDHIVKQHHWYTWAQLPRLDHILAKLLQSYHPNYPESLLVLSGVFRGLRGELEQHMIAEQTQLFPVIGELAKAAETGTSLDAPRLKLLDETITALLHEHELSGQALKEIREVTRTFNDEHSSRGAYRALVDELEKFEEDLHVHIHLESNILFPRARKLIQTLR
jgi:regulator of cell morphogenesis and NO signaling